MIPRFIKGGGSDPPRPCYSCQYEYRLLVSKPVLRKCGDFFPSAQGVSTILTEVDPRQHRAMRNAASPLFSARELDRSFYTARKQLTRATECMMQNSQGRPVDLWSYFQAMLVGPLSGIKARKKALSNTMTKLVQYCGRNPTWLGGANLL